MKRKDRERLKLGARSSLALISVLLSVGVVRAQPAPVEPPTRLSPQERQELEQLRQQQRVQAQVQAEASQIFSRTVTLFNILLAVLALLLVAAWWPCGYCDGPWSGRWC